MISNLFAAIIFAGTLQGFVFVIVYLFSKKYRSKSTSFLITIILGLSLNNVQYLLMLYEVLTPKQAFLYVYLPYAPLIPALLYFYVSYYLNPLKTERVVEKIWYLPFVVFLIIAIVYKIMRVVGFDDPKFYSLFTQISNLLELVSIILMFLVIVVLFRKIKIYNNQIFSYSKVKIQRSTQWLLYTLLLLIIANIIWLASMIWTIAFVNAGEMVPFYFLWTAISLIIYWMGHQGIYTHGINNDRKKIRASGHKITPYSIKEKLKTPNEISIALQTLLVEQKRFLDSNLSLETLAHKLQISKSHLSRIVNNELGSTFTDYINTLRVEEAKSYLQNPDFSKYTIVAIGLEAGFSSKTTFNTTFKKIAGLTPSQYRKNATNTFQ